MEMRSIYATMSSVQLNENQTMLLAFIQSNHNQYFTTTSHRNYFTTLLKPANEITTMPMRMRFCTPTPT